MPVDQAADFGKAILHRKPGGLRKNNITPDTGGKVARIYVEEGIGRGGQLLAEMDTETIRLQLNRPKPGGRGRSGP